MLLKSQCITCPITVPDITGYGFSIATTHTASLSEDITSDDFEWPSLHPPAQKCNTQQVEVLTKMTTPFQGLRCVDADCGYGENVILEKAKTSSVDMNWCLSEKTVFQNDRRLLVVGQTQPSLDMLNSVQCYNLSSDSNSANVCLKKSHPEPPGTQASISQPSCNVDKLDRQTKEVCYSNENSFNLSWNDDCVDQPREYSQSYLSKVSQYTSSTSGKTLSQYTSSTSGKTPSQYTSSTSGKTSSQYTSSTSGKTSSQYTSTTSGKTSSQYTSSTSGNTPSQYTSSTSGKIPSQYTSGTSGKAPRPYLSVLSPDKVANTDSLLSSTEKPSDEKNDLQEEDNFNSFDISWNDFGDDKTTVKCAQQQQCLPVDYEEKYPAENWQHESYLLRVPNEL